MPDLLTGAMIVGTLISVLLALAGLYCLVVPMGDENE